MYLQIYSTLNIIYVQQAIIKNEMITEERKKHSPRMWTTSFSFSCFKYVRCNYMYIEVNDEKSQLKISLQFFLENYWNIELQPSRQMLFQSYQTTSSWGLYCCLSISRKLSILFLCFWYRYLKPFLKYTWKLQKENNFSGKLGAPGWGIVLQKHSSQGLVKILLLHFGKILVYLL